MLPSAPYSGAANSPAALGDPTGGALIYGTGDPLGSAQLFPVLNSSGTPDYVQSWSYNLVAGAQGADLTVSGAKTSVDPLAVEAGTQNNLVVQGQHAYGYEGVKSATAIGDNLYLKDGNGTDYSDGSSYTDWLAAFDSQYGITVPDDTTTTISYVNAPAGAQKAIAALVAGFFAEPTNSTDTPTLGDGKVTTTLTIATQLMAYIAEPANFAKVAPFYSGPVEGLLRTGLATKPVYATAPTLVRTGTGSINFAASGTIDLTNGPSSLLTSKGAIVSSTSNSIPTNERGLQLGGAAIYTAGRLVGNGIPATDNLGAQINSSGNIAYQYVVGGVLVDDPVYAEGGGDITLSAGGDVLGRSNTLLESELGGTAFGNRNNNAPAWAGAGDQPWRTGSIGSTTNLLVNPQLFDQGLGTLGGGNISVHAGGNVSDIALVATDSVTTANVGAPVGGSQPQALVNFGGGNISVIAGGDILGGQLDVAAGDASLKAAGSVTSGGTIVYNTLSPTAVPETLRVALSDGQVTIQSGGDVDLQGITALGVDSSGVESAGFYAAGSSVSIFADGAVTVANSGADVSTTAQGSGVISAVYPGSFEAVSFNGSLDLVTTAGSNSQTSEVLLYPDPTGTLTLLAAGDIDPTVIAQLDSDPTLLPGTFSTYQFVVGTGVTGGLEFGFPAVLPNTNDVVLRELHNPDITHADDPVPNRIAAGGDIDGVSLSMAKQTRVAAGRDIVNMVFLGQNINPSDITRVTAGRDITATTKLEEPVVNAGDTIVSPELPTLQGNTFVLGGPGALFVEAGRNAGPFLNSAVTDGFDGSTFTSAGVQTYGGGILTVGNLWNPWLGGQSADIFTEFGVAKGQDYAALIADYLTPANFSSLPSYMFDQDVGSGGAADPSREIYALSLMDWLKSVAADAIKRYDTAKGVSAPPANAPTWVQDLETVNSGGSISLTEALTKVLPQLSDQVMPLIPWMQLHESAALVQAYGGEDVTYDQALATFQGLSTLTQREFLLKDVYFNELTQVSITGSSSYQDYLRGYQAVNALFPASAGYSQSINPLYSSAANSFLKQIGQNDATPLYAMPANALTGGLTVSQLSTLESATTPAAGGSGRIVGYLLGALNPVQTGNLDLRLATIQTEEGGDITILGPGGRVLAGSTVSTSVQASRRDYAGGALYSGLGGLTPLSFPAPLTAQITAIPPGYEGVLTLRGGSIDSFTDGDFLLNQSRAFTEEGGDITLWSSNADVNAGQGPRTTADVPPVVVYIDANGYSQASTTSAVSGAGIGAFDGSSDLAPDVFLIAPVGTVDAGDAGVRSAGNVFIAALQVANADAIQAAGTISGSGAPSAVNVAAATSGDAAATAAAQAAQQAAAQQSGNQHPLIYVDVLGYIANESPACSVREKAGGVCE
ncbi:MAG: filamentous hemagglutinin family protein [Caulobacteraceae bacterium]|nr:filamentous hemagglutinin family protein [Caulobacteraceae bacterium]